MRGRFAQTTVHPTSGYPPQVEVWNALTHALGVPLGVMALVLTLVWSSGAGGALVTACAVYGASLILLFSCSALYHAARGLRAKRFFLICDHISIYVLIAGTYTPFMLGPLRGPLGWTIFGLVWGCALAGLVKELLWPGRGGKVSTGLYLAMGWLCLIAVVPLWQNLPFAAFAALVAGGVAYSVGAVFYLWRGFVYHHVVWHLFVLCGSALHLLAVLSFLRPAGI